MSDFCQPLILFVAIKKKLTDIIKELTCGEIHNNIQFMIDVICLIAHMQN